jgi:hypothetical protein
MVARRGYEGPWVSKFVVAMVVVAVIFIIAQPGKGLWTAALLGLTLMFYMAFYDPRGMYPEDKYKVK